MNNPLQPTHAMEALKIFRLHAVTCLKILNSPNPADDLLLLTFMSPCQHFYSLVIYIFTVFLITTFLSAIIQSVSAILLLFFRTGCSSR